ncbi:MAG TPA: 16S rRNA (guanine(527)-N(7))-methyltransferase RsmG [Pyrinomonadaceae bacterium]|jgi:16S rRNA (guanine527-N7)-methyltransferase
MSDTLSHANEFTNALEAHAPRYGVRLSAPSIARLRRYYEHVQAWNARLHLVAPCPPVEFATRHVLESLLALSHLPAEARVADVGSGAGLPIIPCLIARPHLRATLIEASAKKAIFLREALRLLDESGRAQVINQRFEMTEPMEIDFITCRALDRFKEMLPRLLDWSPPLSTLLLFGGPTLREELERRALNYITVHLPESEQRFLFVVKGRSGA